MKVDFRPSDLLDRVDWNDPDFPAFARMLDSISHLIEIGHGDSKEFVRSHVISVIAESSRN